MAQSNPLPSGHKRKKTVGWILFITGWITVVTGLALWFRWISGSSRNFLMDLVLPFVILSVFIALIVIGGRLAEIIPNIPDENAWEPLSPQ